jgi:imidazolonepropionase-like amidohydrolase
VSALSSTTSTSVLIENVRVFDGVTTHEKASVLVRNGIFKEIGDRLEAPSYTEVVDGTGKTLLPGLFDAHIHTAGQSRDALRYAASLGITTVLDMAGTGKSLEQIRSAAAVDRNLADLFGASFPAMTSDSVLRKVLSDENTPFIDAPSEAGSWVDARIAEGSDFIKIVYDDREGGRISEETVAAIVTAAHERGRQVWVHALNEEKARSAINAGADGLAHLFVGASAGSDFGRLAAEHKISVIPTLSVLCTVLCGEPRLPSMLEDPRLSSIVRAQQSLLRNWPSRPERNSLCKGTQEAMLQLIREQVPILAGTDAAPSLTGVPWGASLHDELELLVRYGLTPEQALAAATSTTARAFGIKDRGAIQKGKRADMLLVEGDPTSDIKCTRNIVGVWKSGSKVDRLALQ